MGKVTYIQTDGTQAEVDVANGISVMQGAVNNDVAGIVAECGGACSCATCHVYVDEDWFDKTGGPSDAEKDMLECAIDPKANSRLSCQIRMNDELNGLVVRIPESQF